MVWLVLHIDYRVLYGYTISQCWREEGGPVGVVWLVLLVCLGPALNVGGEEGVSEPEGCRHEHVGRRGVHFTENRKLGILTMRESKKLDV